MKVAHPKSRSLLALVMRTEREDREQNDSDQSNAKGREEAEGMSKETGGDTGRKRIYLYFVRFAAGSEFGKYTPSTVESPFRGNLWGGYQ